MCYKYLMATPLYNQREFAEKCGVSTPAISKAVKNKTLLRNEDGLISMRIPMNRAYYEKHKGRLTDDGYIPENIPSPKHQLGIPRYVDKSNTPAKTKKAPSKSPVVDENTEPKLAYEIARIKEQTIKLSIDNAEKLGKLVDRSMVDAYFSRFATVFSNYVLPQGQRLSKDISDIFGNSDPELQLKVQLLIDKENERAANEIVRVVTDFQATDKS